MAVPDLDASVRGLYRAATGSASWDDTLASLRDDLGAVDLQVLPAAPSSDHASAPDTSLRWVVKRLPASGSHGATLVLGTHQGTALSVRITWPADQPPDAALCAWLDRLAPHLQVALRAGERMRQWPARVELGAWLLDTLAHPAWLLRADGSIVRANAAARRTETVDRWLLTDSPVLALRHGPDQQALDAARRQALAAPQGRPVLVPAPGAAGGDTGRTAARPAPLQARWLMRRLDDAVADPAADPVLLVILFDPQASDRGASALSEPLLAGAFGFTPAESRVAVCLAQGSTVREIADQLDVAPSTVRSHLDAVMAKLGVTRKLEAVRLLAQGGWMWRAWPSEEMRDA
jgi:DNA-binding CsgD family transcriptional regulator